ncbi:hypothetical protein ATANTOWER_023380 [Ataeniobius toweri]|uniref:Secreted protein n=1 Tax=Ataeniobius toweri TaxID=208326 RepID=A0ABU7AKH6_9TELE|nr:hypothetical protein [Ataeniobius toweri]
MVTLTAEYCTVGGCSVGFLLVSCFLIIYAHHPASRSPVSCKHTVHGWKNGFTHKSLTNLLSFSFIRIQFGAAECVSSYAEIGDLICVPLRTMQFKSPTLPLPQSHVMISYRFQYFCSTIQLIVSVEMDPVLGYHQSQRDDKQLQLIKPREKLEAKRSTDTLLASVGAHRHPAKHKLPAVQ